MNTQEDIMENIETLSKNLWNTWNTVDALRAKILKFSFKELAKTPYSVMYPLYKAGMKQKSAEKFIEDWVAAQLGVNKKTASSYDKNNDEEGLDLGDLVVGDKLIPGKNNIELKVSFENDTIGGGQLRFYEPLAGYLFMKAWSIDKVEFFYLTKDELLNEIYERTDTPYKVDKNGVKKYYTAFSSSQGSGKIKGSNENRLKILQENIDQKRQDLIGWDFNTKTEKELYKKWQTKYCYTTEQLKEKLNEL